MTKLMYIALIAAFGLGLVVGANTIKTNDATETLRIVRASESDRDQAFGRLDECESIIKAHSWTDADIPSNVK